MRNSESQTDADTDKRLREIAFVRGDDADAATNFSVAAGGTSSRRCERRRVRARSERHRAVLGQTLEPDRVSLPAAMGIVKIKNPLAAR